MVPLVIVAITGLTAVFFKILSLTASRTVPPELAHALSSLDSETASETAQQKILREFELGKSTLARLGSVATRHAGKSRAEITAAVEAASREEALHLQAGTGVIDVVITVAPLLGLVGTASGLVVIFENLGETSNHAMISRGIAEALSTTIFGIATAVPAVIAHNWCHRRVEKISARLEILLNSLISALARPDS